MVQESTKLNSTFLLVEKMTDPSKQSGKSVAVNNGGYSNKQDRPPIKAVSCGCRKE